MHPWFETGAALQKVHTGIRLGRRVALQSLGLGFRKPLERAKFPGYRSPTKRDCLALQQLPTLLIVSAALRSTRA